VPVCTEARDQMYPQGTVDGGGGGGGIILAWQDGRDLDVTGYDIYGEHLDSSGNVYGGGGASGGVRICSAPGDQENPMLANNSPNEAIYAWVDFRNGLDYDIYTLDPEDWTLPVELSSFTAIVTPQKYVQLDWITQSETGVSGYYIYRSLENNLDFAEVVSPLITAANTSQEQAYRYTDEEIEPDTWYYWLQDLEIDGQVNFHGSISVTVTNDDEENPTPEIPIMTGLSNIYPNPFNPLTTISYVLAKNENVKIQIFNMKGQLVCNLESQSKLAGTYHVHWDGKDSEGRAMPSGVYCVKMSAGKYNCTRKVIMMK